MYHVMCLLYVDPGSGYMYGTRTCFTLIILAVLFVSCLVGLLVIALSAVLVTGIYICKYLQYTGPDRTSHEILTRVVDNG